jgi:hypothetical protein
MLKLFKKKELKTPLGIVPRGVNRTIVPKVWIDGKKNPVWDSENPLHKNKIYL